ncbi:unannotated protein [freshwater metagenome]|uniref:Unannotated protein n=1 Tax=freshwater metagenome TaxID=449393 RepID=A0A6J6BBA4_9ZZZZ
MYLLHDSLCNLSFTFIQSYLLEKRCTIINGKCTDFSNALSAQSYSQYLWLKSGAFTCWTRCLAHIRFIFIATVIAICFRVSAVNKWHDAFESSRIISNTAISVFIFNVNFVIKTINDGISCLNGEFLPRVIHREFQLFS